MAETFNRASVALTTTGITDIYQGPNIANTDRAIVLSCLVANVNATAATDITLTVTDAANNAIARIASTIAVPADATLEAIPNKLILKQGEKLRATATNAGYLEITVSALEMTA
jgi:hypothetical protein